MVTGMLAVLLLAAVSFSSTQAAGPTIKFERARESRMEGSLYCFHLIAVGTFEENFAVEVKLCPLTAHHLIDYSLLPPDVALDVTYANFTVGQINSTTVCVILVNNNAWEPLELFQIKIEIPSGVTAMLGSPSTSTVNIIDDDEVRVSFGDNSVEVAEDIGKLTLQLQANGIYTNAFSVSVRCLEVNPIEAEVTNSLSNISDAYPESFRMLFTDEGRLTSVSSDLVIDIVDDLITEPTESFICLILRPFGTSGIVVADPDTLTISILDNDILEVSFTERRYTGMEGTTVGVQLQASGVFVQAFQARIFSSSFPRGHRLKDCEADEGEDYTSPSHPNLNRGLVDFNYPTLGMTSTILFMPLVADGIVECASECFGLNFVFEEDFSNPSPLELSVGSPSSATVCIQDRDMMFLRFEDPSYSVREDAGSVSIRLEAVQEDPDNPGSYVPAKYTAVCEVTCRTVAGSAEAGSDYVRKRDKVVFSDGMQFSTPFSVDIVDNEVSECPEEFTVLCSISSDCRDRVKFLDSNTTTVNITDDEESAISFTMDSVTVSEGGEPSFELTIRSNRAFQENQMVMITAQDGTAEVPSDFVLRTSMSVLTAGSLTFAPEVAVDIINNDIVEDVERFMVSLVLPAQIMTCGGRNGENATVNATVLDDDSVFIRVKDDLYEVDEDGGSITFQLEVYNGTVFFPFNVNVEPRETSPVSATDKDDFEADVTVAMFPLGSTESMFARTNIIEDEVSECDETFQVEFFLPSNLDRVVLLEPSTIDVVIKENDDVKLMFNKGMETITEDPSLPVLEFYIDTDREFERDQQFTIVAEDGTAMSGTDFTLLTPSVTIEAGKQRSDVIRVRIEDDIIVEDVEMFKLRFELNQELMDCRVELAEPSVVDITIEDDDPVFLALALKRIPREIIEGNGSAIIQIEVQNGTIFFPITVSIDVRELTTGENFATEFVDFYVFGDENEARLERFDNVSSTAEIRTVDNLICEMPELFEIEITINQPRVKLLEPTRLNLTIIDDDISDPDVDCFPPAVVSFNSDALYVVERGGRYRLPVYRVGKLEKPLVLNVTTEDLTTTKGVDYMLEDESITFANIKDEFEEIDINFRVPRGDGTEPREAFRIDLSVPDGLLTRQIDVTVIIEDKN